MESQNADNNQDTTSALEARIESLEKTVSNLWDRLEQLAEQAHTARVDSERRDQEIERRQRLISHNIKYC